MIDPLATLIFLSQYHAAKGATLLGPRKPFAFGLAFLISQTL